jgi:hypothetical protein
MTPTKKQLERLDELKEAGDFEELMAYKISEGLVEEVEEDPEMEGVEVGVTDDPEDDDDEDDTDTE